jgi:hypothetical protein
MFKSIVDKEQKKNKTENINEYMKEYRKKNPEYYKNYEKCKYYKAKYGLTQDFIDKYGEQSADMYKLILQTKKLIEKKPELKESLIKEFLVI